MSTPFSNIPKEPRQLAGLGVNGGEARCSHVSILFKIRFSFFKTMAETGSVFSCISCLQGSENPRAKLPEKTQQPFSRASF